jgi:hypothetical protein
MNTTRIKIEYTDKDRIIGSSKETKITKNRITGIILYKEPITLILDKVTVKSMIRHLTYLKHLADTFKILYINEEALLTISVISPYDKHELQYKIKLCNSNIFNDGQSYNIAHFISILKELNPYEIHISIEANKPLFISDNNGYFVLAGITDW